MHIPTHPGMAHHPAYSSYQSAPSGYPGSYPDSSPHAQSLQRYGSGGLPPASSPPAYGHGHPSAFGGTQYAAFPPAQQMPFKPAGLSPFDPSFDPQSPYLVRRRESAHCSAGCAAGLGWLRVNCCLACVSCGSLHTRCMLRQCAGQPPPV
jgi:hypothetical protein